MGEGVDEAVGEGFADDAGMETGVDAGEIAVDVEEREAIGGAGIMGGALDEAVCGWISTARRVSGKISARRERKG